MTTLRACHPVPEPRSAARKARNVAVPRNRVSAREMPNRRVNTARLLPAPEVQGALQDEDGREAVPDLLPPFAADAGFDQVALRLGRGHPLVPRRDGQPQALADLLAEPDRLPGLRALPAVEVKGEPDHDAGHFVPADRGG